MLLGSTGVVRAQDLHSVELQVDNLLDREEFMGMAEAGKRWEAFQCVRFSSRLAYLIHSRKHPASVELFGIKEAGQ